MVMKGLPEPLVTPHMHCPHSLASSSSSSSPSSSSSYLKLPVKCYEKCKGNPSEGSSLSLTKAEQLFTKSEANHRHSLTFCLKSNVLSQDFSVFLLTAMRGPPIFHDSLIPFHFPK